LTHALPADARQRGSLRLEIDRLQHGADALVIGAQRLRQFVRRARLKEVAGAAAPSSVVVAVVMGVRHLSSS
jgi:hypothetical protein